MTTHFPADSAGKEPACNAGDLGSIPGSGRYPGVRHGNPLQYSCLENPYGQRSLVGYSPQGHKQSDMTEWLEPSFEKRSTKMANTVWNFKSNFVSVFKIFLIKKETLEAYQLILLFFQKQRQKLCLKGHASIMIIKQFLKNYLTQYSTQLEKYSKT